MQSARLRSYKYWTSSTKKDQHFIHIPKMVVNLNFIGAWVFSSGTMVLVRTGFMKRE